MLLLISTFAQLCTLIITWPLWNVRTDIPHLPVFELGIPQVSFGWVLVLTLAVVPFRPRLGVWLHFALMLVASLFDQMRTQPQFLATWILMLATLGPTWKNYIRWFLSSLWIWAGLHKAFSPEWNSFLAFEMADVFGLEAKSWFLVVAIAVAVTEIVVGLLAWWKPKWGAIGCVLLHVGIVIWLLPPLYNWNFSVIPWNLATAVVGFWILWTCDSQSTNWQRWTFCVFMIAPVGFYFGALDHGYSHVLYSGMIPRGLITRTDGSVEKITAWGELAIPFPNERRTIKQRFLKDSQEGDRLHIRDPRASLSDLHFIKRKTTIEQIDRSEFFSEDLNSVTGFEFDSRQHIFLLSLAGAKMFKRSESTMIYVIEFDPERFDLKQLEYMRHVPNIEQIQLSDTSVTDEDMELIVEMPKLEVIALDGTAITDRGIGILSKSKTLKQILINGREIRPQDK